MVIVLTFRRLRLITSSGVRVLVAIFGLGESTTR
jgi:hypothetical protein